MNVTITIDDACAEPILREAARKAALYSAWIDYLTRRTGNLPCPWQKLDERKRGDWHQKFVAAKRMVEAFGVEYEPTSEDETITTSFHLVKTKAGTRKIIAGLVAYESGAEWKEDFSRPYPNYRRGVHQSACEAAADRVVRRWRATLTAEAVAA